MVNYYPKSAETAESTSVNHDKSIRLLLADAHQLVREGLRWEVAKHDDMEVVGETGNGRELIQLSQQINPHIIILDTNLQEINGFQAISQLNSLKSQTSSLYSRPKLLVFSGQHDRQHIWSVLTAAVDGYLLKQDPPEMVIQAIRTVTHGHTVLSQQVQDILLRFIPEISQSLNPNEVIVLQLLANGLSDEEIAKQLKTSQTTVKSHLHNIYRKTPWIRNRAEAIAWAWVNQIVVE